MLYFDLLPNVAREKGKTPALIPAFSHAWEKENKLRLRFAVGVKVSRGAGRTPSTAGGTPAATRFHFITRYVGEGEHEHRHPFGGCCGQECPRSGEVWGYWAFCFRAAFMLSTRFG